MTPRQFEIEFERARKNLDDVKAKEVQLTTEDRQYYLNEAIHVIINKKLKNSEQKTSNGIKRSQRELDELRSLIVKNANLTQDVASSTDDYNVYDLPANYYYLLADKSKTVHCSVTKTYLNRMYPSEELQEIIEDTHYTTRYNSPISELAGSKLYVYKKDSFTISNVYIDYIKQYAALDLFTPVNTDLDTSMHKDIVNTAVMIFLEGTQRFRPNVDKNVLTEQINV